MKYEISEKIVKNGESRVFKNWKEKCPNLTEGEFLDNLKWLCEDPRTEDGKLTREIALSESGIVRLKRAYGVDGLCTFYKNGLSWGGEIFHVEPRNEHEKMFAEADGKISILCKISLSAMDRVD